MTTATLAQRFMGGLPLTRAADLFEKRPHVATLHRWCLKGCRGVKLQSWFVGGVRHTDQEAVATFLLKINSDNGTFDANGSASRDDEAGTALANLGC